MRYRKNQMGSLEHEGETLTCSMGFDWPPVEVVAYGSPEEAKEHISDSEMHRVEVWAKLCGLRKMDYDKCASCKYLLSNGVLINQSTKGRRGISLGVRGQGFSPKNKNTPKR